MLGFQVRLPLFIAALWWGGLVVTGLVVVPMLFANLSTPAVAGAMAARLFSMLTLLTLVCGLALLALKPEKKPLAPGGWACGATFLIVIAVLAALTSEFGVAPRIVARVNLAFWHGLGSALFVLQAGCATCILWRLGGPAPRG